MNDMKLWRVIKLFPVLLAGVLAVDNAAAAPSLKVQSPHFTLIGNISESQMTNAARAMEEFLPSLIENVPAPVPRSTAGLTIVLFNDEAAFDSFKPRHNDMPTGAVGYFLPGEASNFITAVAGAETERVLYHELFHALSRQDSSGRLPTWANEGLAEFYSTFDTEFGDVIPFHVATLRMHTWIPLTGLLAASKESFFYNETAGQTTFYAESWALVHYLLAGSDGARREQLATYLALRSSGKSIAESVQQAFRTDIAGLEGELRQHVAGLLITPLVPNRRKHDAGIPLTVTAITEAEWSTHLGDLLFHLNRYDAAEKQFQHAMEDGTPFPGTLTSMGMLRMRQNRNVDALPFLKQAIEKDAENYLAHFCYAAVVQALASNERSGRREKQMELSRLHLEKAVELAPWFTDAYRWLGYVAIALENGYDGAEDVLKKALKLEPEKPELLEALTEVRNASTVHAAFERAKHERESRKQLQEALEILRVKSPPVVVTYELWRMPDPPRRKPPISNPTLDGSLIAIECRDGITLVVRTSDQTLRFHTKAPGKLEFASKVSNAANDAACGFVRPEQRVTITYRRTSEAWSFGEPLKVEYK